MAVELNHTIVRVSDKWASARFYTEILGLPEATSYGPFVVVELANRATLDFADDMGRVNRQHYAFLVTEEEFDGVLGRIRDRGLSYWADPYHRQPQAINHEDGGRGVYWDDPDGHVLEAITRPYGSG